MGLPGLAGYLADPPGSHDHRSGLIEGQGIWLNSC
jgi:hypothetical protein